MNTDEAVDGPIVVAGHVWSVGDRVYFPCYSMGSIVSFYRAPYVSEFSQMRAIALCDDGETRKCALDLQCQLLGYGDHKDSYLASSLEEREAYYKNKPKHPMPYEVGLMGRKNRIEAYTDEEYAESMDYKAKEYFSQQAAKVARDRKSVTHARKPAATLADRQSVTSPARSVVTIDQNGSVIADHPGFAPAGKNWCKCQNCQTWFLSARPHTKTCTPKCRKALSRRTAE